MATKKTMNTFEKLNKVDVSQFTEKKGQFNYLSWAHAVRELLKICPTATWEVHLFDGPEGTKQPYMKNGTGAYVQVSVDVDGVIRSQIHPVLDNRNQTIDNPNAFQVNTSIQRCLAKAIALHGLGLYIFAGEDLPEADPLTSAQAYELNELAQGIKNQDLLKEITDSINNNKVNSGNYEKVKKYIGTIITKQEEKKNG
tara:strand:- start:1530 stop:2123 length:594 start_codon:yes stop_codon:yes gene_type:complete